MINQDSAVRVILTRATAAASALVLLGTLGMPWVRASSEEIYSGATLLAVLAGVGATGRIVAMVATVVAATGQLYVMIWQSRDSSDPNTRGAGALVGDRCGRGRPGRGASITEAPQGVAKCTVVAAVRHTLMELLTPDKRAQRETRQDVGWQTSIAPANSPLPISRPMIALCCWAVCQAGRSPNRR